MSDQVPSTPTPAAGADLEKKLLEAQLSIAEQRTELERLKNEQAKASKPPAPATLPPPQLPKDATPQDQISALSQFANDQAREVQRLRTANRYGLKEEELSGEFSTPVELELAAQVKLLERQVGDSTKTALETKALLEQLVAQQKAAAEASQTTAEEGNFPDAGGPTGLTAKTRAQKVAELRQKAEEAKKGGKRQEATWLTLQSIYKDRSKVMLPPSSEEE